MNDSIKVHVVDYGRKHWYMRYVDPITGKQDAKSTGVRMTEKDSKKLANRVAAKREADLREGRYKSPSKTTWEEFRERYEAEKLPGCSGWYRGAMRTVMNRLERFGVSRLSQIDAGVLGRFVAALRADGVADSTIRTYLKHIRAALAWGHELGIIAEIPKIKLPKMHSKMKGRPITTEEFERMLAATRKMGLHDPAEWRRYLTGLWLSGLRLEESLRLSWEDGTDFAVDLTGRHPMFRIAGPAQKSRRAEVLPMTPDFAEWLLSTAEDERQGRVFKLPDTRADPWRTTLWDGTPRQSAKGRPSSWTKPKGRTLRPMTSGDRLERGGQGE